MGKGPFTTEELVRYGRHIVLPEVGTEGQEKLKAAKVLLIGAGGLGSPAALYLAASGVGTLGIVDFDVVDSSNLQRQVIHGSPDVGRPKVESARERIAEINPHVIVEPHQVQLSSANAMEIFGQYDIIVDGTDNFPTRYLSSDACVMLKKPLVYGSIFRFDGQVTVFDAQRGPCYRCLFPAPPPPELVPNCAEGGVLGVLPGIVGTLQALEAIKIILGKGELLIGRLLTFDALGMRFQEFKIKKDKTCPVCGEHPTVKALIDYEEFCGVPHAATATTPAEISVEELKARQDRGDDFTLLDVREPYEYEIANINGKLIPLGQLQSRMTELDPSKEVIVHCRSGGRSMKAAEILRKNGFKDVKNLAGGIGAWSDRIDKSVKKY